ncbi:tripeptide aminopeptidase [Lachnospiraceae bacterium KH1T2]|nr:tripeptide aminopeptidase [Lachnospiraceae bacterium KH1T2]
MIKNQKLIDRFFKYVKIDTQSSEESTTSPSTMKQHDLAKVLKAELEEMGASEIVYDEEHCYIYACIPGEKPAIGFIAHMDTSPAVSGANVKPRIIENFDGNDSLLKTEEYPELLNHFGEDIIATDGTTLLGADDKAGVAEIMQMAEYFLTHPEIKHREIRIAFTPDEEIGAGTEYFDIERFGAPEAYTVDGGKLGVIEYENFNAAAAKVHVHGKSVHPGSAKGIMKNALEMAMEFNAMLPSNEKPEYTEGYEGFYFLESMKGDVESAELSYIIRDHDRDIFEKRKEMIEKIAAFLNMREGEGSFEVEIRDQYYNMVTIMKDHMELIENAKKAFEKLGVNAVSEPIRGGTDGAMLTLRGLPCPNLCTGGYNYHGRYEYASVQEMEKCSDALIEIAKML